MVCKVHTGNVYLFTSDIWYVKYVLYISTQLYFQHTADSTNVLGLLFVQLKRCFADRYQEGSYFYLTTALYFSKVHFKSELLESSESVPTWCPYELVLNLWPVPSE